MHHLRRRRASFLSALVLTLALLAPTVAVADEYDDSRSGHPLRVAAYLLHPVGVLLDYAIFRPAHWIGSHEPLRTIFGHTGEED